MTSLLALLTLLTLTPPTHAGTPATCPTNNTLSCHNTTTIANTCCFNSPGGQLLQTQFWDTSPAIGPAESWTVHGLWPDNCDGSYDQYCDKGREYTNITQILQGAGATALLQFMQVYWVPDRGSAESFWEHEWSKHATCISTLSPDCYADYVPQQEVVDFFNLTVNLFQTLNTYEFLANASILPSTTQNYTLAAITAALSAPRNGVEATVSCTNGALDQVWYYFNVLGSVQTGEFVPTAPDGAKGSCPDIVAYLPKGGSEGDDEADGVDDAYDGGYGPIEIHLPEDREL